jgi:hypothetical protein
MIKPGNPTIANREFLAYSKPLETKDKVLSDLDQKINWFRSENIKLEETAPSQNNQYLRVEVNGLPNPTSVDAVKKIPRLSNISRDVSDLSSANLLNEMPPLSEISRMPYNPNTQHQAGDTQLSLQNFFAISDAPKLKSPHNLGAPVPQLTSGSQVEAKVPIQALKNFPTANSMKSFEQRPEEVTRNGQQTSMKSDVSSQLETIDPERARLQALVEAQKQIIADMQTQLREERLKSSKLSVVDQHETLANNSPHHKVPNSHEIQGISFNHGTLSGSNASKDFNMISQASLDSMFQTYISRQKDWQKIKNQMMGKNQHEGIGHPDPRLGLTKPRPAVRGESQEIDSYHSNDKQLENPPMQPKIQIQEVNRKRSQKRSRSNSTSRLSVKSGASGSRVARASLVSQSKCERERERGKKSREKKQQRRGGAEQKPGTALRACGSASSQATQMLLQQTGQAIGGAVGGRNKESVVLEPATLALLSRVLQRNKEKSRVFAGRLQQLVHDVIREGTAHTRVRRKAGRSCDRSRTRLLGTSTKPKPPLRASGSVGSTALTLDGLSQVLSSQRSRGSATRDKKRKRVK